MTLTAWDVYACQQVWKWEQKRKYLVFSFLLDIKTFLYLHPQHSFLHNFLEGAGQVAEEVAPELLHVLL